MHTEKPSRQTVGFVTTLEEYLRIPLQTEVLGVEVTVRRVDVTEANGIVAGPVEWHVTRNWRLTFRIRRERVDATADVRHEVSGDVHPASREVKQERMPT